MSRKPKTITGIDVTSIDWSGPFMYIYDDLCELAYQAKPSWDNEDVEAWAERNATRYVDPLHDRWIDIDPGSADGYRLKERLAEDRGAA